jgi:hypothetical protein
MPIIAIITDPDKGGTFLSWSLHYLAGHTRSFHSKSNAWFPLPKNPLTNINSHNFKTNDIKVYSEFQPCIDNLKNANSNEFHTIYFHNLIEYPWSNDFLDTKKIINDTVMITDKIILLTNQPKNSVCDQSYRRRSPGLSFYNPKIIKVSDEDQLNEYIDYFFKDSKEKWKHLTDQWDLREFLALNMPDGFQHISPLFDLTTEHYDIDYLEWVNSGELLVQDIFKYFEMPLDQDRFAQWNEVYQFWRTLHHNRLMFLYSFDKIITYILNNYYMDLTRFDLDIIQEAFIQRELIYKHNLNLKTFQLEKFINTQQLHNLLEPNIHPLGI